MPQVSIIIPAYNSMNYLPETIESVFHQTFDDLEVIIVNDGSTDETEQWVSQIADQRVKLISQENRGNSEARNTGIRNARGQFLAFLDADDLWDPTKLEKQVRVLENNPEVGLVYTWVAYTNERGQPTGKVPKHQAEGDVWKKLIEKNLLECGSVPMVRSRCFDSCGVFDPNLGSFLEDWDMWLRIASQYPFQVIQEPLVYYRQHSLSGSKNWEAMEKSFRLVIEKAFTFARPELLDLKEQRYGSFKLDLAWKCLQSRDRDYKQATYFRHQALLHSPQLRFSKEYVRLSIAIFVMRWLGVSAYEKVRTLLSAMRRVVSTNTNTSKHKSEVETS